VRSRVLFDVVVGEDERPMCKSPDTALGFPNMNPPSAKKAFPWAAAGFDPTSVGHDEEGRVQVACGTCKLKDWGSHPQGDKPWCSEQYVLPILFGRTLEEVQADQYSPGLLTFQKSGLKSTKQYLTFFKNKGVGAYISVTRISLTTRKAGNVTYSVPGFTRVADTVNESGEWANYAEQFAGIKQFLNQQRPPAPEIVEDASSVGPVTVQQAVQQTVQQAPVISRPPVQQSVPVVTQQAAPAGPVTAPVNDDDDLPF
jgi:hypothetical protein